MMTNPLREGYIRRKRWCEKGQTNLGGGGGERERVIHERKEEKLWRRKLDT